MFPYSFLVWADRYTNLYKTIIFFLHLLLILLSSKLFTSILSFIPLSTLYLYTAIIRSFLCQILSILIIYAYDGNCFDLHRPLVSATYQIQSFCTGSLEKAQKRLLMAFWGQPPRFFSVPASCSSLRYSSASNLPPCCSRIINSFSSSSSLQEQERKALFIILFKELALPFMRQKLLHLNVPIAFGQVTLLLYTLILYNNTKSRSITRATAIVISVL